MTQAELITMAYIFFARILDVSMGTIRIILISRGYRYVAPLIGFFEILIWLTAISRVITSLDSAYSFLVYAAGFAAGNYVGMLLEAKLPFGYKSLRVITTKEVSALPLTLRGEGFGVTVSEGTGLKGPVSILYSLVPKKKLDRYLEIVNILEPGAFITIEEVRAYRPGFISRKPYPDLFGRLITKRK
ncbi:MAG: hypothetical protein A2176_06580 [Spirochaetes bacterium RBG_13_51_14]|nr:MAG: hypothetical protein A2176_06580 [Spirochaetes bacterium RBG_13_51_14]